MSRWRNQSMASHEGSGQDLQSVWWAQGQHLSAPRFWERWSFGLLTPWDLLQGRAQSPQVMRGAEMKASCLSACIRAPAASRFCTQPALQEEKHQPRS